MSRCPYCDRELPGFETLCQQCFEAGYDRIAHPIPWWRRMRLTADSLYTFLLVFGYLYLLLRINRDHHPTMMGIVGLASVMAAFIILIATVMEDFGKSKTARGRLYVFAILFAYFFCRIWVYSTYHPFPRPALFAFVIAAIAAFAACFRRDPVKVEDQQKKAPEDPAPLRTSREMRSSEN